MIENLFNIRPVKIDKAQHNVSLFSMRVQIPWLLPQPLLRIILSDRFGVSLT